MKNMKKRFLSGFLALVMCLGLLPASAWATGEDADDSTSAVEDVGGGTSAGEDKGGSTSAGEDKDDGTPGEDDAGVIMFAGEDTGGGTDSGDGTSPGDTDPWESPLVGLTISGAVWSGDRTMVMAMDEDAMSDEGRDHSRIFEALVSATTGDYGGPVSFYFPENPSGESMTRRVSFFSYQQLDASKIVLGQGATLAEPFQETVLGSGEGTLYMYQGLVTFHMMQAMFYYGEGDQASIVDGTADAKMMLMVYTYELPTYDEDRPADAPYVGEVFVTAADGEDLTVEISGVNLPDGAMGTQYSIRNGDSYENGESTPGTALYTCSGWDQSASDPDHGVYAYTMTPTGNEKTQDSWFPLYIGSTQAYFYGNNKEPVTMPTLAPMTGGGTGSTASTVKVQQNVTTTGASATVSITNSGYTQMRYQVDGGNFTDWSAIPASVTISTPEVKTYNVTFEFREGATGTPVSKTTTVTRQSTTVLPAPTAVGIVDANTSKIPQADGTYHLINGARYTIWARLEGGRDESRGVTVEWDGVAKTLTWNEGNKRYEATVTFNGAAGIGTMTFRAQKLPSEVSLHDPATVNIDVVTLPGVYAAWAPTIKSSYEDSGYLVQSGQSFNWSFNGDEQAGYKGYAKLLYKDENGTEKSTVSDPGEVLNGCYWGTVAVPNDAAALVNITYFIADSATPASTGKTKIYSMAKYKVGTPLVFDLGTDYAETRVIISRTTTYEDRQQNEQGYYRFGWVNSSGKATLDGIGWEDDATYAYSIYGDSGLIKSGTLTRKTPAAPYTKGDLGLPDLIRVTVKYSDALKETYTDRYGLYPRLIWQWGEEEAERGANLNLNVGNEYSYMVPHIPVGATVTLGALVYNNYTISGITATCTAGGTAVGGSTLKYNVTGNAAFTLDVTKFDTSSTVTAKLIKKGGNPVGWADVTVRQEADIEAGTNGILNARHLSRVGYGYLEGLGVFHAPLPMPGCKAEVTISSRYYKTKTITLDTTTTGDNNLRTEQMEFRDELVVTPVLTVAPMKDLGDQYTSAPGDTSLLMPRRMELMDRTLEDGKRTLLYTSESLGNGQSLYFLPENKGLQEGDRIKVYFDELPQNSGLALTANKTTGENTIYGAFFVVGTLDANQNMTIVIPAAHQGAIEATVVPESADPNLEGRLLVYKSGWDASYSSTLVGQAAGRGTLRVSDIQAGDNYTVVTVMYRRDQAEAVSTIVDCGRLAPNHSGSVVNKYPKEIRKQSRIAVENGTVNKVGTLTPEQALDRDVLGDYVIRSTVEQISPDGTCQVTVWVEPFVSDPGGIAYINVKRGNGDWTNLLRGDGWYEEKFDAWYTGQLATLKFGQGRYEIYPTSQRLTYQVKPEEGQFYVWSDLEVWFWRDGEITKTEYRISESIDRFELEAPNRFMRRIDFNGTAVDAEKSDPWTVSVTLKVTPKEGGTKVTFYDNGTAVGTYDVTEATTKLEIPLTKPYQWGLHEIYATREVDGEIVPTEKSYVNVANPKKEINVSNFIWWHHNDRGYQQWNFEDMSEMKGKKFRYWPARKSAFAFAIVNADAEDLTNVKLSTSYKGAYPHQSWYAESIDKDQFISYWKGSWSYIDESKFEGKHVSFWVVDVGSDKLARGETVYGSEKRNEASIWVDQVGISVGYFSGFNVTYDYVGESTNLLAAALLPTDPDEIKNLSSADVKTLLRVVDDASEKLTTGGLKNYHKTMGGELNSFKAEENSQWKQLLDNVKNETENAVKAFKDELVKPNVDYLAPEIRDALNVTDEEMESKVTSKVMNTADKENAANEGETVYDGYTVKINVSGDTIDNLESTTTWSTVNIPGANEGLTREDENGTTKPVAKGDAAYIYPDSIGAVEWLMNDELQKKDSGDARYKDVTWSSYMSEQGKVFERQEVKEITEEDGTATVQIKRSTYLPTEAVQEILGKETHDTTVSRANGYLPQNTPIVAAAGRLTGDMLTAGQAPLLVARMDESRQKARDKAVEKIETVNDYYSKVDTVKGVRDAIKAGAKPLAEAAGSVDYLGTGMNVVGVLTTGYKINRGPQGKSEDILYEALDQVKDPKTRQSIAADIAHYSDFKNEIYTTDSLVGAVTAGMSFAGPASLAGTIAGYKYNDNSSKAQAALSAEFDGIMNSITQTLRVQEAREVYQYEKTRALNALTERLEREGFSGDMLQSELEKFTLVKNATGDFGYVPLDGWGNAIGSDKLGYVPEQPDPSKFEIDYGPSFGGRVPTVEELRQFYGDDTYDGDKWSEHLVEIKTESTSLEDLIKKVEDDLKTEDGKSIFDLDFSSAFSLDEELPSFDLYIDPSGYVFEGVDTDRVAGVTATILQGDGDTIASTKAYTAWGDTNEDEDERQINPQKTADIDPNNPDQVGRYGWMTPTGVWKVRFADDDNRYQTTETKPMEVPPEHTAVNIGLLATAAPEVAAFTSPNTNAGYSGDNKVEAYADRMKFSFTKWMQLESLVDVTPEGVSGGDESFASASAFVKVTDADGNPISGTFTFPDRTANTGYKASVTYKDSETENEVTVENPYQTDYIGSDWFVKTVVFTPDAAFDSTQSYRVTVSKTAVSYAGVALGADFTTSVQPSDYTAPYIITFVYGNGAADTTAETGAGGKVTLPAPSREGYTFLGWFTAATGGSRITADTVFTEDTTVYAQWKENSSTSGGGSSTTVPTTTVSTTAGSGDKVSASTIDRLISSGKKLTVTGDNKATAVFSTDALKGIGKAANAAVTVTLEEVSGDYAKTYPGGEVYSLKVTAGTKAITDFGGDVTVTLPHTLGKEETNPKRVTVFALNEDGTVGEKLATTFDEKKETAVFTTDSAGAFVVGYVPFPFKDVEANTWYYDAVDWADLAGITTGKSATVFDPLGEASRAEVVTFLWRCAGSPEPETGNISFSDVEADSWYTKAVLWATEKNITQGTGGGNFSPKVIVTRDQFVTLLYRMVGTATGEANPFTDVKKEDYFYEAVLWAAKSGVTNGTSGTLFSPDWHCDRSQLMTMLYRWFGKK